ncbi:MAG: CHAT domain-containing tetratricopeptide repeat protein [Crocinitomicaceae bacterium]
MFRLLSIIPVFLSLTVVGQKFADKEFYLVDSLAYDEVSREYQELIDGYLAMYHGADQPIRKLLYVNQIVKLCWDENVWPKYNRWVLNYSNQQLEKPQTDTVHYQFLQAKAGALYYIGWDYSVKTEYDKCISYYLKCKEIYEEIHDSIGVANSLDNIGSIYAVKGEFAKALEYHNEGLKIREQIGDTLGMGGSLNNMGVIKLGHGDYENALDDFERALKLHEQVKFISGVSTALNNLGTIHLHLEDFESALSYHEKSLIIREYLEDKQGKAHALTNIGRIKMIHKDTAAAVDHFKQGISLYEEMGDKRGVAATLCNLGAVQMQKGEYVDALDYFNRAYEVANKVGASLETRNSLIGLFTTYIVKGEIENAEKHILELLSMRENDVKINFAVLPEKKKELYFQTMAEDFMNFYAFANIRKKENPNITEIAYNNALKLKGLLLKSSTAMREAVLSSENADLINQYNNWITLKKEIAARYAKGTPIDSLENTANQLERELIKNSTAFDQYNKSTTLSWKDVKKQLQPSEVAIEFIHFKSEITQGESPLQYAALIISAGSESPQMINICTEEQLENILETNSSNNYNFVNEVYGSRDTPNHELYELIWQPLETALEDVETVYFSATGSLHKIAFAGLCKNKTYLSDRYHLVQLSSTAQLLNEQPFTFTSKSTATLFGGVNYSSTETEHVTWTYLDGSLREVDSISVIIENKVQVKSFKEDQATEERFKEVVAESNFLHIASHGFFYPDPDVVRKKMKANEEVGKEINFRGGPANYGIWNFVSNKNPLMRSGIALAGANDAWNRSVFEEGEDGVLTAQEVATLNMRNTYLVVLSACETALGDIKGSEGVYGLQRAFKMAGVRYLIMSLWQVPDKETAEFMTIFYKKLFELNDIRKAFSATQREMSTLYDPYFWAAFVLVE